MSHGDGNSTEGESTGRNVSQTGTGSFRNFDHLPNRHRRSNSSQSPCLPTSDGPPIPISPLSQKRLLDLTQPEVQQLQIVKAPLAQDETQLIPSSPRDFISPGGFKDFIDAENLMPLATSDFRNPVCLEMKNLRSHIDNTMSTFDELDIRSKSDIPYNNNNNNNNNHNNGDMGSMDSSDTFASCNTHPFHSQGDLTSDIAEPSCAIDSNLYVNPLDKSSADNSPVTPAPARVVGFKKSASGDTALRSLTTSPMDETYRGFGPLERGSRVSLNDSPLPKQRRTRFQQGGRPRTRFGDAFERDSQESLEAKRGSKKTSFISSRPLASASRIINQHLFGLQNISGSRSGKNSGSKSSLSVDSIDSRASPQLEHHRRSKSILKKSESSGYRNTDPESERLISDNTSGFDIGSGNEYSPNKRLSSPPVSHRTFSQRRLKSLPPMYQHENEQRTRTLKSSLFLLDDIIGKEKQTCNEPVLDNKLSDSVGEVPLYICPPPPPMDDHSPTEETRLLLHNTVVSMSPRQTGNSIAKGSNIPS